MRRKDREVTGAALRDIVNQQMVCRVAMVDEGMPYIVPLNFGPVWDGERLTLIFHSATEGRKIDVLRKNPRVAFEMDGAHRLIADEVACRYSYAYQCVMGEGTMRFLDDPGEKSAAMNAFMRHIAGREGIAVPPEALSAICVMALDVDWMTGKSANIQ